MVRKKTKTGKSFEDENIQQITVKEKIYIEKKEKVNLVIPIEKNQKICQLVDQKKKPLLGLLSYNAKSAQN